MAMVLANDERDYAIKPEASAPSLDTSTWPLLLKNYDKRAYTSLANMTMLTAG